jgi:hypothetical protein
MYQMLPARDYPNTAAVTPHMCDSLDEQFATVWTVSWTALALPATFLASSNRHQGLTGLFQVDDLPEKVIPLPVGPECIRDYAADLMRSR